MVVWTARRKRPSNDPFQVRIRISHDEEPERREFRFDIDGRVVGGPIGLGVAGLIAGIFAPATA